MNQKEYLRFFANRADAPQRVSVKGALAFARFPKEVKEKINQRLAEKDPVMMKAMKSTKFGIKIDGQEVGRDNIKDFEISKPGELSKAGKKFKERNKADFEKLEKVKEKLEAKPKPEVMKFTSKALFKMNKSEQVELLKALGVEKAPRFERSRVKKILELQ